MRNKHLSTAILCLALAAMVACKGKPSDSQIQTKVTEQLSTMPEVTADVKDGVVTLAGNAPDEAARASAETAVAGVEGVKSITNNIMVTPPAAPAPVATDTAAMANPADEALRTGVADITKDFPGANVKVEAGVITVTGELSAAKWKTLKQALDGLHPKRVDASGLKVK
ncbi:BON domain-containing protein [Chitinophaga rhizophila]|uniref:BON domain-containing protein n=1 Tax=Chitinophaga rhizophila TaxID=2866212 RepID=A0ABS7GL26_9BACT|nr:BON domain-containing protein [Chitinophaga rhizophila]MBW8687830.1 BON domain-containing protein [Chitinophaga rhizophila]